MYRHYMYNYFEDDCIVTYTGLLLSRASEFFLEFSVLFNSIRAMKTRCYIFCIRAVVPLGSIGVSLLSFCCVFHVTCLAWL